MCPKCSGEHQGELWPLRAVNAVSNMLRVIHWHLLTWFNQTPTSKAAQTSFKPASVQRLVIYVSRGPTCFSPKLDTQDSKRTLLKLQTTIIWSKRVLHLHLKYRIIHKCDIRTYKSIRIEVFCFLPVSCFNCFPVDVVAEGIFSLGLLHVCLKFTPNFGSTAHFRNNLFF